jgi:hypothetical protein
MSQGSHVNGPSKPAKSFLINPQVPPLFERMTARYQGSMVVKQPHAFSIIYQGTSRRLAAFEEALAPTAKSMATLKELSGNIIICANESWILFRLSTLLAQEEVAQLQDHQP